MQIKIDRHDLIKIQKPGRYIGGEQGIPEKDFLGSEVRVAIAYPDIYEIGMSNHGIRIIYDRINSISWASCERLFSPWTDFSDYLEKNSIPLFSLETKSTIKSFDMLGVSIQYELLFTNFLHMLHLSQIPLRREERDEYSPLVILGGPGVANPAPFTPFADAFFVGEVELRLESIMDSIRLSKQKKQNRNKTLQMLSEIPGIYVPGISIGKTVRQIHSLFSDDIGLSHYLIPNIDIIQNKLVIEIMRGCPNKCRFCQAGILYKPARERSVSCILDAVDYGLSQLGVSEVTLSSLSSADYSCVIQLAEEFNRRFNKRHVSFSFPSLRVESFPEELLNTISSVRKSGLTFAVETGSKEGQQAINKPVQMDTLLNIISYAVEKGWRQFKFYFMIGLPDMVNEVAYIISFLERVTGFHRSIQINCNLAVFIPKPHTPYEKVAQLELEKSIEQIDHFHDHFRRGRVKIKSHNAYTSYLEGLISRGDEKIGELVLDAYLAGAQFCGWKEHFNYSLYEKYFQKYDVTYERYWGERRVGQDEPWYIIDTGVESGFYEKERDNSKNQVLNSACNETCDADCHICANMTEQKNEYESSHSTIKAEAIEPPQKKDDTAVYYLFKFAKLNNMTLIGHIDMLRYFERIIYRSQLPVIFTEGFNPRPKMQFSPPLPVGMGSEYELGLIKLAVRYESDEILKYLNKFTHSDIPLLDMVDLPADRKKFSLMEIQQAARYRIVFDIQSLPQPLNKLVESFNSNGLLYNFERKNKEISGNFADYISIESETDSTLTLFIKKIVPSPKLEQFCSTFAPGSLYMANRLEQFAIDGDNYIDLFKYILLEQK